VKVSSTEIQNNFGKYLLMAAKIDIVITRNGTEIAVLSAKKDSFSYSEAAEQPGMVREVMTKGNYGGWKASYAEFLSLSADSEERYEYIDGEIYLLSSPKVKHQSVLTELFGVFFNWFKGKKCRPFVAPFDITLRRWPENINVVQPDIMVICDLEEKLNDKDYYMGIPTLIVEILSESTRSKDSVKKLDLYMSCGVREYWIVSPIKKEVYVHLLADGDISDSAVYKKGEIIQSFHFEGLQIELDLIFK